MELAYSQFAQKVLRLTGIDLNSYKSNQMERRLQTMMRKVGVNGYADYVALLERNQAAVKELKDFITINVSEFFRNPEKFEEVRSRILPLLLEHRPNLKVWSAGCSNGSEPYTLSILLDEVAPGGDHQILATDLDEEILKVARAGRYPERDLKAVTPERLQKYFVPVNGVETPLGGRTYQVRPQVQRRVTFRQHNLLRDDFGQDFDLIVCRNVVIYFTEPVKDRLYRRFWEALRPGGVLFVGGTESILNAREIGFETYLPFFYRKVNP